MGMKNYSAFISSMIVSENRLSLFEIMH